MFRVLVDTIHACQLVLSLFLSMSSRVGDYVIQYNAKDVILYALSIGLGSVSHKYTQDLRYVFEDHDEFSVFPTFALTLMFWATSTGGANLGDCSSLLPFPPPLMKAMGIIPAECLREEVDLEEYPIIHTSQSIYWNRDLPLPKGKNVVIRITGSFVSVIPKSVGTFITTAYELYGTCYENASNSSLLCSIRSTALILGIDSEVVRPFQNSAANIPLCYDSKMFLREQKTFLLESECWIAPNTALLYRLAGGDTNRIHVDSQAVPMFDKSLESASRNGDVSPLLHGLCTMSIAARIILQFVDADPRHGSSRLSVQYLSANFVKPVFVNDTIIVQAWLVERSPNVEEVWIAFVVRRKTSGIVLLDCGQLRLLQTGKANPSTHIKSRI